MRLPVKINLESVPLFPNGSLGEKGAMGDDKYLISYKY